MTTPFHSLNINFNFPVNMSKILISPFLKPPITKSSNLFKKTLLVLLNTLSIKFFLPNKKLYFLNRNIDYNVFHVYLKKHDFYKCSFFYYVFLCYIRKRYTTFLLMDLLYRNKSVMYKHIFLNTNKWNGFPCHGSFKRVKSINSFMHFLFKTSANNFFFHNMYISHVFLNT